MRVLYLFLVLLVTAACSTLRSIDEIAASTRNTRPPAPLQRPIRERLSDFQLMVQGYSTSDQQLIVPIDFLPNDSGITKELPSDLGFLVEDILTQIGAPFLAARVVPNTAYANTLGAAGIQSGTRDIAGPFTVSGCLLQVTERAVRTRDARLDVLGNDIDAQGTGNDRHTLTSIRVMLSLRGPADVAQPGSPPPVVTLPGCSAIYEIFLEKTEQEASASFYVAGTGGGITLGTVAAEDIGDALYDATAACLIHLLGNALLIPYYRLGAPFTVDTKLDERLERALHRLSPSDLEANLKRYLFAAGFPVSTDRAELTEHDRGIVASELSRRGLAQSANPIVSLTLRLWKELDYRAAAERIEDRLAEVTRISRARLLAQAEQGPEEASVSAGTQPEGASGVPAAGFSEEGTPTPAAPQPPSEEAPANHKVRVEQLPRPVIGLAGLLVAATVLTLGRSGRQCLRRRRK